ncbi:MAG: hypothetical protein J6B23_07365 [Clostridia bacterium]|nr:hypothetical protein [Clostridia bacterium]
MINIYEKNGITGKINTEISSHTAYRFGQAYGQFLKLALQSAKVLVAKDTRASGDMMTAALSAGFCSVGVNVVNVGTIPVPALSYLINEYKMSGGAMISAPKCPAEYSGICFLDGEGNLIDDAAVDAINKYLEADVDDNIADFRSIGRISRTHTGLRDYVDYIKSAPDCRFRGIKLAIDCANGATFESAKLIFKELGADVEMIHNLPDGFNINEKCGYCDTASLQSFVPSHKCDIGIAFDGVGVDFAVTDENGELIPESVIKHLCDNVSESEAVLSKDAISGACRLVRAYCMNDKKMSELCKE